ncbi:T9SS type A sorting domain-containing protein [Patiriisocius sp. Uisw_017]|jgi:hypothetical protein|uniref:T9SS type A sorting domain-containing protein n=1 Tax=Patiriisocius sp. Uisw_017 TaxID=3230968 RepID=UPI0039EAD2E8
MKNLCTILIICSTFVSLGQQDILQQTDWHIAYIELDGETYTSPIINQTGIVDPNIVFEDTNAFAVLDPESDSFFADITYSGTSNQFTFTNAAITLPGCEAFCEFADLYFDLLVGDGTTVVFDYNITFVDFPPNFSLIILTITDAQGNIAVYNDAPILRGSDFTLDTISIHPNPTKDVFFIDTEIETLEAIFVYNALGEKTRPVVNLVTKEVDLSSYPSGIYFVSIEANQQTLVKRIIKE